MTENLAFLCVCGEPARAPSLAEGDSATLVGYGDGFAARWFADEALAREGSDFKMLGDRPRVGDVHWLHVTFPFAATLGESFWCLHEPPSFRYNGLDEGDDISQFAFVRCRMTEAQITAHDVREDSGSWKSRKAGVARVAVEAVTTLEDLIALPPSDHAAPEALWADAKLPGPTTILRQGSLVYVLCTTPIDTSIWAVLHDTAEATDLLVFGENYQHADTARAGRTPLRRGSAMIGPGVPPEWLSGDGMRVVQR